MLRVEEGYTAHMLPAISFEDCLFADLGVDPGVSGRLMYEATDFLIRPRKFDPTAALILLQVGAIALFDFALGDPPNRTGPARACRGALQHYPADHRVAIYRTSQLAIFDPSIDWVSLEDLPGCAAVDRFHTLCASPVRAVDRSRHPDAPAGDGWRSYHPEVTRQATRTSRPASGARTSFRTSVAVQLRRSGCRRASISASGPGRCISRAGSTRAPRTRERASSRTSRRGPRGPTSRLAALPLQSGEDLPSARRSGQRGLYPPGHGSDQAHRRAARAVLALPGSRNARSASVQRSPSRRRAPSRVLRRCLPVTAP